MHAHVGEVLLEDLTLTLGHEIVFKSALDGEEFVDFRKDELMRDGVLAEEEKRFQVVVFEADFRVYEDEDAAKSD